MLRFPRVGLFPKAGDLMDRLSFNAIYRTAWSYPTILRLGGVGAHTQEDQLIMLALDNRNRPLDRSQKRFLRMHEVIGRKDDYRCLRIARPDMRQRQEDSCRRITVAGLRDNRFLVMGSKPIPNLRLMVAGNDDQRTVNTREAFSAIQSVSQH